MTKSIEELREERLEREALRFARLQLTSGSITESDVYAMFGKRRNLYMNAIYSLEIDDWGTIPGDRLQQSDES